MSKLWTVIKAIFLVVVASVSGLILYVSYLSLTGQLGNPFQ